MRLLPVLALAAALSACSPTYYGVARLTNAKRTCPPHILVDLDFAAILATFVGSTLAFKAEHPVRAGIGFVGAFGIAFGSATTETSCVK